MESIPGLHKHLKIRAQIRWCTGTYSCTATACKHLFPTYTMVYRNPFLGLRQHTGTYYPTVMVYEHQRRAPIPSRRWCTGTYFWNGNGVQAPISERRRCKCTYFLTATVYRHLFLERRRCTGTYTFTAMVYRYLFLERRRCTGTDF